jgi:hypothetical protein
VIYLDTSVALAWLLSEDRRPPDDLWSEELVSSRLLEYELWTRLHDGELLRSHGDVARAVLARVSWLELRGEVLDRALYPFPVRVRTLHALHLASLSFLTVLGKDPELATYDRRMADAARAMGFALRPLDEG